MNTKTHILALALLALGAAPAFAVEGALGRPVSGATIAPYAGLVPPEPGWLLSIGETYYDADIGGNVSTPIGGNLALDLSTQISFIPITALYIWDTHSPSWNFASAITVPLANVDIEADVVVGSLTGRRTDSKFGVFDIAVTPIIASHHFSETDHLALSFTVWAPTGEYEEGELANLSLNNWTFIPTIAYTKIFPTSNIELTGSWGVQFYTENPATDYQNGILSDFEVIAVKRFTNGFGAGLVGSWIQQVTDDDGTTADALNGFKGKSFGLGPIFTYSTKVHETDVNLSARWVHEFETEKRFEGDVFTFSAGVKF